MGEEELIQYPQESSGQFVDLISCYQKSATGKLKRRSLKDIAGSAAESLCALANADGGTVILGAEIAGEAQGSYFDEKGRHHFSNILARSFSLGDREWHSALYRPVTVPNVFLTAPVITVTQ